MYPDTICNNFNARIEAAVSTVKMDAFRIEHAAALQLGMIDLLACHTELFKQFSDNLSLKKRLGDPILGVIYIQAQAEQFSTGDVL